jgi:hypothetical protein
MAFNRIPGQNGPDTLSGNPEIAFATSREAGIEALGELGVVDTRDEKLGHSETMDRTDSAGDEKGSANEVHQVTTDEESLGIGQGMTAAEKVENREEIALHALHVDDDPSLNPWTFRTAFLGEFQP